MTDFFKHGNKVYSENLNDGILVGNSFDWTVNISLPVDTGGVFPNSTTAVKAKVADCSITPNSNLSIGETITNNAGSSQVYRLTVYPNFNRFGGFTFVSLEGDGSVIITEVGASAPIRNNLDYSNLGDVVELKQLKEYDIVVTIPSGGEVTGLGFGFQSATGGVNASISQSNVTGLTDALNGLSSEMSDGFDSVGSELEIIGSRLDNIESGTYGTIPLDSRYFTTVKNYWSKDTNFVEINVEAIARGTAENPTLWIGEDLPTIATPSTNVYGLAIVKANSSSNTFTTVPFVINSSGASILGSVSSWNVVYINIVYSVVPRD